MTDSDQTQTCEAGEQDSAEQRRLSGRARVRALLIEPLVADGLIRHRGTTVEVHAAFLDKLAARLAYLEDAMLLTLRDVVLRLAEGPSRNLWPGFVTIWNNATLLCPPPDDDQHIMITWLRSRAGPGAMANGTLVELHSFLRRMGRPPSKYDNSQIAERAAANRRRREMITEWAAVGRAQASDLDWLNAYNERLAYCEALVRAGETYRAELDTNSGKGEAA